MVRISTASAAASVVAAALALGLAAPSSASPNPDSPVIHSSGMSAEFPVGRCIEIPNSTPMDFAIPISNPLFVTSVPCTDPNRAYRVVAHVPEEGLCGVETSRVYYARDVVVLCTVQDHV
jgi:hypothetical protein